MAAATSHTQLAIAADGSIADPVAGPTLLSDLGRQGRRESMADAETLQLEDSISLSTAFPSSLPSEELGQLSRLISRLGLPDKDIQLVKRILGNPAATETKGKGREISPVHPATSTLAVSTSTIPSTVIQPSPNIPFASPRTRWESPSGSVPTANNAIQSLFDEADRERLLVENAQLRRQAAMVANKRLSHPDSVMPSRVLGDAAHLHRQVKELTADRNYLLNRIHHSEAQKERLEAELRQLRSFLLSKVTPVPFGPSTGIPILSDTADADKKMSRAPELVSTRARAAQASRRSASADTTGSTVLADDDGEYVPSDDDERGVRRAPEVPDNVKQSGSPKKRRLSPDRDLFSFGRLHALQAPFEYDQSRMGYQRHRKNKATMGDAETEHLLLAAERLTRVSKSVDWSLPVHSTQARRAQIDQPQSGPFVFPDDKAYVTPTMLSRPFMPRTTGTALRSPFVGGDIPTMSIAEQPASIFASPPVPSTRKSQATPRGVQRSRSRSQSAALSILQDAKPDKAKGRIGRPLGSPNKTKTISINETTAMRKRAKQREFIAEHGFSRPKGRPSSECSGLGEGHASTPRAVFGTYAMMLPDDNAAYEDDLLRAAQIQSAREAGEYISPADEAFMAVDQYSTLPQMPEAEPVSAKQIPPITPVMQQGESPIAPKTPTTIDRQLSALDVLADQAASASKKPDSAGHRSKVSQSKTVQAVIIPPNEVRQYLPIDAYDASNHVTYTSPGLPDVVTPQLGFSPGCDDADYRTSPRDSSPNGSNLQTIAQQLWYGVDESHPLIDQSDLVLGMTPAAALAKKSRSPYLKWTSEEDRTLLLGVAEHGTKWHEVAKGLPNRSYHQCRQRWLRGMKSGKSLPKEMKYLQDVIDAQVRASEDKSKNGKSDLMLAGDDE